MTTDRESLGGRRPITSPTEELTYGLALDDYIRDCWRCSMADPSLSGPPASTCVCPDRDTRLANCPVHGAAIGLGDAIARRGYAPTDNRNVADLRPLSQRELLLEDGRALAALFSEEGLEDRSEMIEALVAEIERDAPAAPPAPQTLRELGELLLATLRFYADPNAYEPRTRRVRPVIADGGQRARDVLNAERDRVWLQSALIGWRGRPAPFEENRR